MPLLPFGKTLYGITGFPQNGDEIGFDVYQRYLSNWDSYFNEQYIDIDHFVKYAWDNTKKIQQSAKDLDIRYIAKLLSLSWNTEYLLSINGNSDVDLLRISNQWKPIQAYYAVYSGLEALIYALDTKMQGHAKCLNKASELLTSNSKYRSIFTPWSFAYKGYLGGGVKKVEATIKPVNFPDINGSAHPLTDIVRPVDSIATCLRAEHKNRIKDWKSDKKSGRFQYLHDPGYTTFFHFLYRLRKKANYEDVETFLVEAPLSKIQSFSDCLSNMVNYTHVMIEIIIMRTIGVDKFLEIANKFLSKNANAPISNRIRIYKTLYS